MEEKIKMKVKLRIKLIIKLRIKINSIPSGNYVKADEIV